MISVTKRFEFEYAHFLPDYPGACGNLHGHRGELEVEVAGPYDGMAMIIDFSMLKEIVQQKVIAKMDHAFINDFIDIPTAENMVVWIVKELDNVFIDTKMTLTRVRLYETSNSFAEWRK